MPDKKCQAALLWMEAAKDLIESYFENKEVTCRISSGERYAEKILECEHRDFASEIKAKVSKIIDEEEQLEAMQNLALIDTVTPKPADD